MPITSNDVANQAVQLIGDNQPLVTGQAPTFDSSTTGIALSKLYAAVVQTVGRQFAWDMARNTIALTMSGNTPPFPWTFEYLYPTNGIEVWQVHPGNLADVNNPIPVNWSVANAVVGAQQQRVVWCNLAAAQATYNNNPNENTWDSLFREAVVRLLASELSMAVAGKPDAAQAYLESGGAFETIGEARED
jgi:hypothetical protein